MKKIFISYSSDDREFVAKLVLDLSARGFEVWYDQWELEVGDSLIEKIEEGIQSSSWLCIILSPSSIESRWVKEELKYAFVRQLADKQISNVVLVG